MVVVCWMAAALAAHELRAQVRVRQPQPVVSSTMPGNSVSRGFASPTPALPAAATLGQPSFDPYSTVPTIPPNAASVPPTLPGSSAPVSPQPRFGSPASPALGASPNVVPGRTSTWPTWTNPGTATPGYAFPNTGYPAYPQQPSALFPNGAPPAWCPNWAWPQPQEGRYLRLFQDVRFSYTWLDGGDGTREMGIDEAEIATTVNFPNFLWSGAPLQVSPVFIMHWWDGPETSFVGPNPFPTELPPRVYSALLDFAWQPYLTQYLSADLDASIGVFTDFEGFTSDSVRIQGTGMGSLAVTPTTTLKAGVTYLDRVDIKLLPAGGIVWIPNPQTRWDLIFPKPKVARYLTTVGNTDIWVYLNGEYGGGSWTVRRAGASDRRMDINDIRVGGGLEWTHQFGLGAFVEAAYVFDRELVFASGIPERHTLKDTVMVRGGLVY